MIRYHLEFIFYSFHFLARTTNLLIQLFTRNQIIRIHIHIFLSGLLQFSKFCIQFFFVLYIFIFSFIYTLKLIYHMSNHFFLLFQYICKIFLQNFNEFFLIHNRFIGAAIYAPAISPRAYPPYIRVLISTNRSTEGPATFFTFDQCRKQMLITLPFVTKIKCIMSAS